MALWLLLICGAISVALDLASIDLLGGLSFVAYAISLLLIILGLWQKRGKLRSLSWQMLVVPLIFIVGAIILRVQLIIISSPIHTTVSTRSVAHTLLAEIPAWLFAAGLGIFFLWYWAAESKHWIQETVAVLLDTGAVFKHFEEKRRKKFIIDALQYHNDPAKEAIIEQIADLGHRNRSPLGRKRIKSFNLSFFSYENNPVPSNGSIRYGEYFKCVFSEVFIVSLTSEDIRRGFHCWFTFGVEAMSDKFQDDTCIYRDLIYLSPDDQKQVAKTYEGMATNIPARIDFAKKLINTQMSISSVDSTGPNAIVKLPCSFEFEWNQADAIKVVPSLKSLKIDSTDSVDFEITNQVHFPVWKKIRGFPLVFMSYSKGPRIEYSFDRATNVSRNSFIRFFPRVHNDSFRLTKISMDAAECSADSTNPAKTIIELPPECWVPPSSGVYITWQLPEA